MSEIIFELEGDISITAYHGCVNSIICKGEISTSRYQDKLVVEAFGAENLVAHIPTKIRLYDIGSYEIPEAIEACGFGKDEIQQIIDDLKELL